ncbi:MAG TPA: hypothetical protein VD793_07225 [Gemmatimonadales bacterium]|nr:hypothetical protein [Gemmatimonadales bacterium]
MSRRFAFAVVLPLAWAAPAVLGAQDQPYVVDYYYKAQWGHAAEFIALFKKNHYPVLRRQVDLGRILQVTASAPRYHGTEDGRWDYRVTIVFKNVAAAMTEPDLEPILQELYPDRARFEREEQRRFQILLAHWDVPMVPVELTR